jgi:hypothetical protein
VVPPVIGKCVTSARSAGDDGVRPALRGPGFRLAPAQRHQGAESRDSESVADHDE